MDISKELKSRRNIYWDFRFLRVETRIHFNSRVLFRYNYVCTIDGGTFMAKKVTRIFYGHPFSIEYFFLNNYKHNSKTGLLK